MCLLAASYNKRNKLTKQMHAHMLRVGRAACSGGRGGRVEVEVQVDVEVQVEVEVEVQAEVQMQVEVEVCRSRYR